MKQNGKKWVKKTKCILCENTVVVVSHDRSVLDI